MKCNKKFLAVAAAGVLTVATAVPALALENEIYGAFTSFYDLSNYSAIGNNAYEENPNNAFGLDGGQPTQSYFVQRVRLGYNAKASDNVKLLTRFELDYNFWGNSSYVSARGGGGAIGADSVNIETKSLYLDLNYPMLNTKIGMMGNTDAFKGILFDTDMAGIKFAHNYTNASVAAGFYRWHADSPLGKNTNDLLSLDAKYSISKNFKIGASYYYIQDDRQNADTITTVTTPAVGTPVPDVLDANGNPVYDTTFPFTPAFTTVTTTANPSNDAKVHTVGLNAEGAIGPITLNGFALAQFGDRSATEDAKGYAFNVGAKMPLAGGTLRSEFLYVAGGNNALFNAESGTEAGGFYDGEMIFLGRDKNATTIDNAIIYDVSNYGQGVILGTVGFDYAFNDKLSGSANAGFAAIADDNENTVDGNDSDYLGTELNAECNYQLTSNVTLGARGGYMILGDYFDGVPGADNIYDLKILARYAF